MTRTKKSRRSLLHLLLISAAFCAHGNRDAPAADTANTPRPPNVVLILTDDQGYGDVGFHGNTVIHTPVMDRLASEGVRLRQFYVGATCAPTRASLLTGRYNVRTGVFHGHQGGEILAPRELTIAEILRPHGYRTAILGKWHLGRSKRYGPRAQGFDEFLGFRDGMFDDYDDPVLEHNERSVRTTGDITTVLTDAGLRFMETNRDRPFFLYLAYNLPHIPKFVPEEFEELYRDKGMPEGRTKMYGMISCVDAAIGRILDGLDRLGLDDDTIVIFLSDNGPQFDNHPGAESNRPLFRGFPRYNAGLRGHKGQLYEGGIRVPFVVRWPGRLPAGKTVDSVAANIDVLPTILDLCGLAPPASAKIDGVSLASILKSGQDPATPPHEVFVNTFIRVKGPHRRSIEHAVRSGDWKLVYDRELYNIADDPGEQTDLAAQHPDVVERLRAAFKTWSADVGAYEDNWSRPPIPIDGEDTPSFMTNRFRGGTVIDLSYADFHGPDVRYVYRKLIRDVITWRNRQSSISWELDVERAGKYEIVLSYGCAAADAGARIRVTAAADTVEGTVYSTTGPNVWRDWTVGVLDLPRGPTRLQLSAVSAPGPRVMEIHEVRLQWADALNAVSPSLPEDDIYLESDACRITIDNAVGGKIRSFYSKLTDTEYFFQDPRTQFHGPTYSDHDVSGLDECFPTIHPRPCPDPPWQGRAYGDHGLTWQTPWEMERAGDTVHMTKDIPDFEIRFERVCSLENARTLRLAYTITNYGQHPFKYFYACHPLLAATPQTHLLIPKQVTQMFTLGGPDLPTLEPKSVISWPPSAATRFNEPLSGSRGSVMKMYPVDLTRGHAAVTHGDNNEALQIQFDIQTLPHLGILVSQGPSGRDDFQNVLLLSLQPSSGACSDPPQCEEMGMGRTLESGAKLHFWVSLGLIDISSVPRSDNLFWAY